MGFFEERRKRKIGELFDKCCSADGKAAEKLREKISSYSDEAIPMMKERLNPSNSDSFVNACLILSMICDTDDDIWDTFDKLREDERVDAAGKSALDQSFEYHLECLRIRKKILEGAWRLYNQAHPDEECINRYKL